MCRAYRESVPAPRSLDRGGEARVAPAPGHVAHLAGLGRGGPRRSGRQDQRQGQGHRYAGDNGQQRSGRSDGIHGQVPPCSLRTVAAGPGSTWPLSSRAPGPSSDHQPPWAHEAVSWRTAVGSALATSPAQGTSTRHAPAIRRLGRSAFRVELDAGLAKVGGEGVERIRPFDHAVDERLHARDAQGSVGAVEVDALLAGVADAR